MISLNLFYEKYPSTIRVHEKWIPIITDFREYIRLFDMLRCDELKSREKVFIIQEYFLEDITIDADAEIKQRIMYRGIDLSTVKDKEEKKRIARIQRAIRLPAEQLSDYDIGNVFA